MNKSNKKIVVTSSMKGFLELTRPLLTANDELLLETLVLLELKGSNSLGTLSEIVKLQKAEIVNEIALRN